MKKTLGLAFLILAAGVNLLSSQEARFIAERTNP